MNDDQLADLKQFIDSKISQSETNIEQKIDGLEQKIDDVDAKLDTIAETLNDKLEDHEARIAKLENSPA